MRLFPLLLAAGCEEQRATLRGADGVAGDAQPSDAVTDIVAADTPLDSVGDATTQPIIDAENDSAIDVAIDVATDATDAVTTAPTDIASEATGADGTDATADDTLSACQQCSALRPIILVHGINGGPENFDVMAARLLADGWPADYIVRFQAADPAWGCNVDNAAALAELVRATRERTCQGRVDVVAHSMGTLSSRYYIKNLGGQDVVNTYVTLGGMHHGLLSPCFAPEFLGVCVWQELCQSGDFITQLNADPATPGQLHWVSIYGTADQTVPNESSHLDGAENIAIEGAEHDGENGLLQREDAYAEVKRVLGYDCW